MAETTGKPTPEQKEWTPSQAAIEEWADDCIKFQKWFDSLNDEQLLRLFGMVREKRQESRP